MKTIIKKVAELDPQEHALVERLYGRPLQPDYRLLLQVFDEPEPTPLPEPLPEWCYVLHDLTEEEEKDWDESLKRQPSFSRSLDVD